MASLMFFILGVLTAFLSGLGLLHYKLSDIATWTFHKLDGRISKISAEWEKAFSEFKLGHSDIDSLTKRIIALEKKAK
jgi:hypothetical protein